MQIGATIQTNTATPSLKRLARSLDTARQAGLMLAWGRSSGDSIPQKAKDAAERARALLRDISAGKAMLAGGSEIAEPATAGQAVDLVAEANPPAFKRDQMAGF